MTLNPTRATLHPKRRAGRLVRRTDDASPSPPWEKAPPHALAPLQNPKRPEEKQATPRCRPPRIQPDRTRTGRIQTYRTQKDRIQIGWIAPRLPPSSQRCSTRRRPTPPSGPPRPSMPPPSPGYEFGRGRVGTVARKALVGGRSVPGSEPRSEHGSGRPGVFVLGGAAFLCSRNLLGGSEFRICTEKVWFRQDRTSFGGTCSQLGGYGVS